MVFLTESWFWRGTQSAIFYYAACTPWVEYKHNRRRRKDAEKAQREREDSVIYAQPGVVKQPAPFQTNEGWTQEIVEGPGPPKGWKKDGLYHKYAKNMKDGVIGTAATRTRGNTATSTSSPAKSDWTVTTNASTVVASLERPTQSHLRGTGASLSQTISGSNIATVDNLDRNSTIRVCLPDERSIFPWMSSAATDARLSPIADDFGALHSSISRETGVTGSNRSSFDSLSVEYSKARAPRSSMEKRLSTAMDGFKETIRMALHPDHWNWIRYDRDDEILSNLNDKVRGMWETMKEHMTLTGEEHDVKMKEIGPRIPAAENEVKKWQRGQHPALNDMHPPIVSQLPHTREAAQWMLLPPASADVMMGRARPDPFDDMNRKPLCVIGRPAEAVGTTRRLTLELTSSDGEGVEFSESENDWMAGPTHIQKPQRPHLWKHRATYG